MDDPPAATTREPRDRRGAIPHLIVAACALALIVASVYAVQTLSLFTSPMLFLAAIFLEAVFILVFVFALVRAATRPSLLLRSLAASSWEGLESNPYIVRSRSSQQPVVRWFRNRFRRDTATGIRLTATVVVAAIPLWNFIALSIEITRGGSWTVVDHSLANLMPAVRTPGETAFFGVATLLGSLPVLALVTIAAAGILWWRHDRFLATALTAVALGQGLLGLIAKLVAQRPRPDISVALLPAPLSGYPSAEALGATVVYGMVAYLAVRAFRSTTARVLIAAGYVLLVLTVALSRAYLGVTYATDVWGGILLGAGILAAAIGTCEIAARFPVIRSRRHPTMPPRILLVAPAIGVLFALVAAPVLVNPHDYTVPRVASPLPSLTAASLTRLPLYSRTSPAPGWNPPRSSSSAPDRSCWGPSTTPDGSAPTRPTPRTRSAPSPSGSRAGNTPPPRSPRRSSTRNRRLWRSRRRPPPTLSVAGTTSASG